MKHDLILTNLSNLKNLDDDVVRLFIARVPFDNMDRYNVHHVPAVAPSGQLLHDAKSNAITWEDYVKRYRYELALNANGQALLNTIYDRLDETRIALVCYCGDHHCHALILGHYFEELGVNVVDGVVNRK